MFLFFIMSIIQSSIAKLFNRESLSVDEAEITMREIMSGAASPAQIGAFLGALRVKGETIEEIVGSAKAMRAYALRVSVNDANAIDTCGTGGDKSGTFNISTTASFVAAGAGAIVAKHGNRAASSQAGSADVLGALGVNIMLKPEQVSQCVNDIGIGFAFAPNHHPAMKHAAGPRRELGARTIFNILGPLANPAFVKHQLLGVPDPKLIDTMATVLKELGAKHVMVVCGHGNVDELITTGVNQVCELHHGSIRHYELDPQALGLTRHAQSELLGGSAELNASITRAVLDGSLSGAKLDVVLLNAGAALYVADATSNIGEGIEMARAAIANGAALRKLSQLAALSTRLGAGA
jgi:anthranilate phosphoribosyltransferase